MMSCDSLRNSEPNTLLRTEVMASVCPLLLETALMAGISTISNASEPFRIQDPPGTPHTTDSGGTTTGKDI